MSLVNRTMTDLCAALLKRYEASGPFTIEACDEYAEYGLRSAVRQRFYKAVKAEYFVQDSSPTGKRKHALFKPGPNLEHALSGAPVVVKVGKPVPTVPDLCEYFHMHLPENFSKKPYPNAHVHKLPWSTSED